MAMKESEKVRTWRPALLGLGAVSLCAVACPDIQPCEDLKPGDEILITIGEPTNVSRCHAELGLTQGSSFTASVIDYPADNGTADHVCIPARGEVGAVGDWMWTEPTGYRQGMGDLASSYTATRGSCVGTVHIELNITSRPSEVPQPGKLKVGYDASGPDNPACPADHCGAHVAVQVSRL